MTRARLLPALLAAGAAFGAPAARGADAAAGEWLPTVILGGIVLFVAGVLVRMFVAARFPRGYREWAARRRDRFAERNEAWDREDEELRR